MSRRVWQKPKRPLNYDLMMDELKILGTFGLKTKRELWKTQTELSRVRLQARSLLALRQDERERKEPILMQSLSKIGLVNEDSTLDDVLNLQVLIYYHVVYKLSHRKNSILKLQIKHDRQLCTDI